MKVKLFEKKHFVQVVALFFLLLTACSSKYAGTSPKYVAYEGEVNYHSRLVNASREKVFQILTRQEAFQQICPKGTRVTHLSASPYKEGTLLRTNVDHVFPLEWKTRVEEIIPNTQIRLVFLDGFFAGGTEIWELCDEREYTKVSHTIIVKPTGFLKRMAWSLKVRRKHDVMVETFLDNLKSVAERCLL